MDDLFKVIIWGLIIYFFLKPLFKKKEPVKNAPTSKPQSDSQDKVDLAAKESKPSLASDKNDQYDILREIENMFKGDVKIPESKPQAQEKPVDPYDIYEPTEIKDKDLNLQNDKRLQRDVMDHNPIGYRKVYDEQKAKSRKTTLRGKTEVDSKTEEEAERFVKVLSELDKKSAPQSEFRKKIQNAKSIKDYIIFSEILGKPKALRR